MQSCCLPRPLGGGGEKSTCSEGVLCLSPRQCRKSTFSGPTPDLQNRTLWGGAWASAFTDVSGRAGHSLTRVSCYVWCSVTRYFYSTPVILNQERFCFQGTLRNVWRRFWLSQQSKSDVLLASGGQTPGTLLTILQGPVTNVLPQMPTAPGEMKTHVHTKI